jgi:hypothetical protein
MEKLRGKLDYYFHFYYVWYGKNVFFPCAGCVRNNIGSIDGDTIAGRYFLLHIGEKSVFFGKKND